MVPGVEYADSTEPTLLWVSDNYALDSDDSFHGSVYFYERLYAIIGSKMQALNDIYLI